MHNFSFFCKHLDNTFVNGHEIEWDNRDSRIDWDTAKVAIFRNIAGFVYFHKVTNFNYVKVNELVGLKEQIKLLDSNTKAFLQGKDASNALLWGARGCGKSSVIKAVLSQYLFEKHGFLRVIEVDTKDFNFMPLLFDYLREIPQYKFVIFSDDLSFDNGRYKSLKSTLEGSFEAHPHNVLLYATSNLRHLVQESSQDNALQAQDNINESMAFSDRFPLSIGFYSLGQDEYLDVLRAIIKRHVAHTHTRGESVNIDVKANEILESVKLKAINFATKIGNRSPRSAKDFFNLYLNHSI
ncbi:DUF815 domain-containing protein [Helicobacter saguini]|uniref:DUF815 domain-containing protein n=1 Tax=Helicobacter saguini TaxID=1548018 RepID=A0A347VZC0_9HELI|nr:DUF815 domain-containing protein [Helicobacter saguini]MWV63215.1 DUF815 domain-containing protein [Helicobacter saguini]MWV66116.1 DUF815 domain-containing protein [Helicobacter saguini]MWV68466.1 DUF815 domain-containing protein [Helicobacter saguini]MWV71980.1 DUF815 domain-containing protein [Helicobacter saguini]TLD95987.1 DUF815 domain-containing protein [Helicobacter saguini]